MTDSPPNPAGDPAGRRTWDGRFTVRAEISYRDRKGKPAIMQVITFQPFMAKTDAMRLLEPFGISNATEGWRYYLSQVRDTFSLEQAEPLVDYLNHRRRTKASLRLAFVPVANLMGASAIPSLPSFRDRSVYKLYLEPGYPLEFKVSAINLKTYIAMAHLFREFKEQELEDDQSFTSMD
ncbi:MAG: hypothetical protein GYA80_05815 [Chloroflexi bacterium]|nr:hypothetical protein [Chloroflexota bacterium]